MTIKNILLTWSGATISDADFDGFYQVELPRIYNFFRYRVGDVSLAEDLTAETFEKAWRYRQRYQRDLAAFSTWLFTIARRVAQDHYRKQRSARSQTLLALDEITELAESIRTEDLVQQQADFAHLSRLLARFADRERELVALKYGAGLTNRAIAHLSGLSESNVGVILHRAVQTLREEWDKPHE